MTDFLTKLHKNRQPQAVGALEKLCGSFVNNVATYLNPLRNDWILIAKNC